MAKYTTTIKTLIDHNFDFGLKSYPIFDENYRDTLNNKILYHYYENEIGFETANLFKLYLNQKMNEIMPYYNTLYENQNKILDSMFDNVDIKEDFIRNMNSNANSTSTSNSNNKNLFQDTPQGSIDTTSIENQTWATNISLNEGNINDSSNTNGTSDENYIKHIKGNNGNKYKIEMLSMIKTSLLNIDMLIINDLNELFMQIF